MGQRGSGEQEGDKFQPEPVAQTLCWPVLQSYFLDQRNEIYFG